MDILALIGLGVVLFASTNVDDIFVLLGFYADRRFKARDVIAGQYLGIGALVLVSVLGSLVSLVLTPAYVGLLGLLPVLIGLKKLVDLRRSGGDEETQAHTARASAWGQIASVAAGTIANGGDNIGIYTPLFATQSPGEIGVVIAVFGLMTGVWLVIAHWMVNHPRLGAPIRRYGHLIVPFVLIGLGIFILYEAGSFGLLGRFTSGA